jgi:hypothetical protein
MKNLTIIATALILVIGLNFVPVDAQGSSVMEKFGNIISVEGNNDFVGIGVDDPSSKLSVDGYVESIDGGFKFPDGSIQQTSAMKIMEDGSMCIGFCDDVQTVIAPVDNEETESIQESAITDSTTEASDQSQQGTASTETETPAAPTEIPSTNTETPSAESNGTPLESNTTVTQ